MSRQRSSTRSSVNGATPRHIRIARTDRIRQLRTALRSAWSVRAARSRPGRSVSHEVEHGLEAVLPGHHRDEELDGAARRPRRAAGTPPGDLPETSFRWASPRRSSTASSRAREPSAPVATRAPQHLTPGDLNVPGWVRLAEVRLHRLRPRPGQQTAAAPTASRSCRARSGRRPTATAAARRSACPAVPTRSAACPATRRARTARTTSPTTSWSRSRSGTTPAEPVRTPSTTSSASRASSSRPATAARTSRASGACRSSPVRRRRRPASPAPRWRSSSSSKRDGPVDLRLAFGRASIDNEPGVPESRDI